MTQVAARTTEFSRQPVSDQAVSAESKVTRNALVFLLLHIPLGILMQSSSLAATIHAYLTMLVGIAFLLRDKDSTRVIYLVSYAVGAEILWRGTDARIFWEIGKYSIIAFLLIAMLKERNFANYDVLPVFYFLLLLPAIIRSLDWGTFSPQAASRLTFFDMIPYRLGFDREDIAFHLAGPLALSVAASFFSNRRLSAPQMRNLFLVFLGPATGLLSIALRGSLQAGSDVLVTIYASSRVTSGGIGPNQVSSVLGFATTAAFFLIFVLGDKRILKLMVVILAVALLGQAMLTFSRGGVYNAIGAILLGTMSLIRDRRSRVVLLVSGTVLVLATSYIVLPALDDVTGGGVSGRFRYADDSGRGELMQTQLDAFLESPVFGQGIAQVTLRGHGSHNEYTRTLAEHGMVGVLGFLVIIFVAIKKVLSDLSPLQLALRTTFFSWAFLYFVYTGTRLALPAFAFGIATITLIKPQVSPSDDTIEHESLRTYSNRSWAIESIE